jgi:hypothetical protein
MPTPKAYFKLQNNVVIGGSMKYEQPEDDGDITWMENPKLKSVGVGSVLYEDHWHTAWTDQVRDGDGNVTNVDKWVKINFDGTVHSDSGNLAPVE